MKQKSREKSKILLIENDTIFGISLKKNIESEGMSVSIKTNGNKILRQLNVYGAEYHLIILDIQPPFGHVEGIAFCRSVRSSGNSVPILVLSNQSNIEERISMLDNGASEYIIKPFSILDLLSNIKKLLDSSVTQVSTIIRIGKVVYDSNKRKVWKNNKEIHFTQKELAIFEYFINNPKKVLSREMIFDHVWNYNSRSVNNIIDVHIKNIRKKIIEGKGKSMIKTVRGIGYRLVHKT